MKYRSWHYPLLFFYYFYHLYFSLSVFHFCIILSSALSKTFISIIFISYRLHCFTLYTILSLAFPNKVVLDKLCTDREDILDINSKP